MKQRSVTQSPETTRSKKRTLPALVILSLMTGFMTAPASSRQTPAQLDVVDDSADQLETEAESIDALITSLRHLNLDINNLDERALANAPGVEASDISAIAAHIRRHGRFSSIAQLDEVDGLSSTARQLFQQILNVATHDSGRVHTTVAWLNVRTTAGRSWNPQQASTSGSGSPYRRTFRIRGQYGRLRGALTGQNEPYEALDWSPGANRLAFDHVVAFLQFGDSKAPFELTVGDFSVDTGQGLLHARPFGTRLSASTPWRTLRSWSGISGYAGSTSQRTFRGIAVAFRPISSVSAYAFLSRKGVDARPVPDDWLSSEQKGSIQEPASAARDATAVYSLVQSDLHVTSEQLARRQNSILSSMGWRIEWRGASNIVGVQVARTRSDRWIMLGKGSLARNSFREASLFWSAAHRSWSSRGELTLSTTPSMLFGLDFRPLPSCRFSIVFRSYSRSGATVFGKPFGYKTMSQAQVGILIAAGFQIGKKISTALSSDHFRGDGSADTHFIPVDKTDTRVSAKIVLTSQIGLDLAFRSKMERAVTSETLGSGTVWARSTIQRYTSISAMLHVRVQERMMTRFRLDLNDSEANDARVKGFHISQAVSLQLLPTLSVTVQESLFEAPGTLNRFYIYEPGLAGSISVPVLQDSGSRSSILVTARLLDRLDLEMKYSTGTTSTRVDNGQLEQSSLEPRILRSFGMQMSFQL